MRTLLLILSIIIINNSALLSQDSTDNNENETGRYMFIIKTQAVFADYSVFQREAEESIDNLPYNAKVTNDFPIIPTLNFELNLSPKGNTMFSLTGFWHSTGSRIQYKDYSGEFYDDFIINTYGYGFAITKLTPMRSSNMVAGFHFGAGYFKREYKSKIYTHTSEQNTTERSNASESGGTIEMEIIVAYQTTNYLIGADIGFMFDFNTLGSSEQEPRSLYNNLRIGLVFGLNSNIFN